MKFTTSLAPSNSRICGGFGSSGSLCPKAIADEVFQGEVSGPWLTCYMLRRFGWPNTPSDDYKQLCTWTLTTPLRGLFLSVTPYLGGSNLHFSLCFTGSVERSLRCDPGRQKFFLRYEKDVERWWNKEGRHLYSFGMGKREGDPDKLVHAFSGRGEMVFGLWERRPEHGPISARIPKRNRSTVLWWLGDIARRKSHNFKAPTMNKREKAARVSRFHLRARAAVRATLKDLLKPTHVRDISFTPFGDIDRHPEAMKRYAGQKDAGYFIGAGNTPEYWFKHATPKERKGL